MRAAVARGEQGSGLLLCMGSRARGGWSTRQGAWGFKFWGQHAVIVSCFKGGEGAWGSSNMREEEQCQNDTVQFSLFHSFFF